MQLKLENNEVVKLSEDDSPHTIVGENWIVVLLSLLLPHTF